MSLFRSDPPPGRAPRTRAAFPLPCLLLLGAALATAWVRPATAEEPAAEVKALARTAQFVFLGTVQKAGAANLKIVTANDRTAVVRVDETLRAPLTLDKFDGREVTVFLDKGRPVHPGERLIFFTSLGLFGETLGVVEVGRLAGDAAATKAQIDKAGKELDEESVRERLERAEVAVEGKITALRPARRQREEADSEHDPDWQEAVIQVTSVLKGETAERVTFLYPGSLDVSWFGTPKPRLEQRGIWLLHRHQRPDLEVEGLTALEPGDLLSPQEAEIARRVVKP